MFLIPPIAQWGVYYRTFLCSKLRVLTICYRLETSYISILGFPACIECKNKFDRAQRGPRMVTAVSSKSENWPYLKNRVPIFEISQKLAWKFRLATETLLKKDRTIETFFAGEMMSSIFYVTSFSTFSYKNASAGSI